MAALAETVNNRLRLIWTPEADAKLREMHASGATASAMGKAIGVSRDAIIVRCRRLGLNKPRAPSDQNTAPRGPRAVPKLSDLLPLSSPKTRDK
jgi:hypothetical protein